MTHEITPTTPLHQSETVQAIELSGVEEVQPATDQQTPTDTTLAQPEHAGTGPVGPDDPEFTSEANQIELVKAARGQAVNRDITLKEIDDGHSTPV